ncbi:putative death-receptor fusion protein-domain-containing protein [Xylaria bambusicola]|uniref:putative death-receptor fusion protein-domain-containing protein n=1 Tax=Xylaria bambusicola TaxID=326684 RepID=UPI0020089D58|nr:putative death-receptor fusion protein-domain-containing protein [Xylaria bambusicola]KAI0506793.1 putative death-receptor fusion protein-domain-containing protein [Xylaria bambusicola]
MGLDELPDVGGTSFNQKAAVVWLELQSEDNQPSLVEVIFEGLLSNASQPKQSSVSACSKLCGFVDHCSKSTSSALRSFAFTEATSMKLFNYFIDWNEQDSHRSMRLVLDYLVTSIMYNPDVEISKSIKSAILRDTISVITLQASRPSTKSSMIALDHLLQKKVVYLGEVLHTYQHLCGDTHEATWDSFISRVFAWMEFQNVWTVAGKLLVTILTQPWYRDDKSSRHHPNTWHKFILNGVKVNPEILEPVKVYLFMPLFKADARSTLMYVRELTSMQKITTNDSQGWDVNAMIWVALLEAGKKTGVVGEPDHGSKKVVGVASQLPTHILEGLLCHRAHEARASGLSILVASPTTTKPYALETLRLLQKYLPSFHEDVDPRVRYEVLGHSRNMIRRLHNSLDTLRKESSRAPKKSKDRQPASNVPTPVLKTEQVNHGGSQVTNEQAGTTSTAEILRGHEEFIEWYARFLKGELVPTAPYQRHITSLRAMNYFLKSSLAQRDENSVICRPAGFLIDSTWFRSVLDLIMDPYDDVRETAASLIVHLQSGGSISGPPMRINGLHVTPIEELQTFAKKANELALKTARADHCDGAARTQELLCRWSSDFGEALKVLETIFSNLETKLCAAESDLAAAVLQAPVHGDFASIRYIWNSLSGIEIDLNSLKALEKLQDQVISFCQRIWQAVQYILCDDSPEGHLPEELQQVEGLDTKDLLSYSFRAVHESSNLMRTIAQNARYEKKPGYLAPSQRNFEDIGNLTFEELSNLRHRGAFSTVSQTFTACCQLVQTMSDHQSIGSDLLEKWYEGALNCIYTQGSTTRRSAGIPAIIVGILAAKTDGPSFRIIIEKLQEIGRQPAFVSETDGSNLSQVHALNCLKDIFKTSFLSQRAEPYLTDCLQLAALSLQSEVWAIRNCGLLLLRSLIDSLFGTNETKLAMEAGWDGRTVRISYHKYEALPSLLVNLLELGKKSTGATIGTQTAEAVFPALDIIRRAGPPEGYIQKLYDVISWYLGSHIWHVREIAARTICSLLLTPSWLQSVAALIDSSGQNSNKLHGALLTLRFLLERLVQVMPDQLSDPNVNAVYGILTDLSTSSNCLDICTEAQAVYIDILNFMATTVKKQLNKQLESPTIANSQQGASNKPLALLNIRRGEAIVHGVIENSNEKASDMLDQELEIALATDINVACAMLEAISRNDLTETEAAYTRLVTTYFNVCFATKAPEPRTVALEALSTLIDRILSSSSADKILTIVPPEEIMLALWADLHHDYINPALADAIIRISGPLLAISLIRADQHIDESFAQRLASWAALVSDAGMAYRTFDTRIAAVAAINSLSYIVRFSKEDPETNVSGMSPAHLPWILALYDALTDDDVEVREAAAEAASPLLGSPLVPAEAGARLLRWLAEHFGHEPDFLMHVAGRMVGHNFGCTSFVTPRAPTGSSTEVNGVSWVSAKEQLTEAMRFDDALFVIEEHNQYIDEVREATRWTDVFLTSSSYGAKEAFSDASKALGEWTLESLRTLIEIAQSESAAGGDGPLGWTSKPQVFAICARILLCASALAKVKNTQTKVDGQEPNEGQGDEGKLYENVAEELDRFCQLGRSDQTRLHGLLLSMCEIGEYR